MQQRQIKVTFRWGGKKAFVKNIVCHIWPLKNTTGRSKESGPDNSLQVNSMQRTELEDLLYNTGNIQPLSLSEYPNTATRDGIKLAVQRTLCLVLTVMSEMKPAKGNLRNSWVFSLVQPF